MNGLSQNNYIDFQLTDRPLIGKSEETICKSTPNNFHRRCSVDKGKQMMEVKRKSLEIRKRLQSLENRIKFIKGEQIKSKKSEIIAKERFQKYCIIRQSAENEKKLNSTCKDLKSKEIKELKEKISFLKDLQKKNISIQKEKIVKKNRIIKIELKEKLAKDEAEIKRIREDLVFEQQKKNRIALEETRQLKESKRERNNSLKSIKEEQYFCKMQVEIEDQNRKLEKIRSLERVELALLGGRRFSEMDVDGDLLSFRGTPLSSSRNGYKFVI